MLPSVCAWKQPTSDEHTFTVHAVTYLVVDQEGFAGRIPIISLTWGRQIVILGIEAGGHPVAARWWLRTHPTRHNPHRSFPHHLHSSSNVRRLLGKQADKVTGRLAGKVTGKLAGKVTGKMAGKVGNWLAKCVIVVERVVGKVAGKVNAKLASKVTCKVMAK